MTPRFFIPLILGTAREGRRTEHAARFVYGRMEARPDIEPTFLDVRDWRLAATDNSGTQSIAKKYAEIIARSDGLVIVTPEYNHGYPGELKMMLDMAYDEYARKPAAIAGAGGGLGGGRMMEQLRLVAIELGLVPTRGAVYFSQVGTLFDANGVMKDKDAETYRGRVDKLLDELLWYARALKREREEDSAS